MIGEIGLGHPIKAGEEKFCAPFLVRGGKAVQLLLDPSTARCGRAPGGAWYRQCEDRREIERVLMSRLAAPF